MTKAALWTFTKLLIITKLNQIRGAVQLVNGEKFLTMCSKMSSQNSNVTFLLLICPSKNLNTIKNLLVSRVDKKKKDLFNKYNLALSHLTIPALRYQHTTHNAL